MQWAAHAETSRRQAQEEKSEITKEGFQKMLANICETTSKRGHKKNPNDYQKHIHAHATIKTLASATRGR
jgi:phosphopentomutase